MSCAITPNEMSGNSTNNATHAGCIGESVNGAVESGIHRVIADTARRPSTMRTRGMRCDERVRVDGLDPKKKSNSHATPATAPITAKV